MAVDKLVDSTQLDADLTSVANAIRTKGGTSAQMAFPAGFVSAVQAIPTGGGIPTDIPKYNDGNAYIHVYLYEDDLSVCPYLNCSVSSIEIDWGDGNKEVITNQYALFWHTYANAGYYIIKITVLSGNPQFGLNGLNYFLFGGSSYPDRAHQSQVIGFESGTININSGQFLNNSNVICAYMGESPKTGNSPISQYCNMLRKIELPQGVTNIPSYCLQFCPNLREVTIPAAVTNIASNAMNYNGNLIVHMLPITPPTLASTNAFTSVASVTIYVPYSADHSILDAYKTATNWSTYESKIFEEEP